MQESTRAARLDVVLGKALDVSGGSLGDQDLSECFGSIKTQFGPAMSRLFQNMLVKLRSQMEASYKDICIRSDLDERLLALESVKHTDSRSINVSATEAINESIEQLKRAELESLNFAMKQIEMDSTKLRDRVTKLRAAVNTELDSVSQERMRM